MDIDVVNTWFIGNYHTGTLSTQNLPRDKLGNFSKISE